LKTKIITLESHDDLISVRDKLSWAKTPRILLVWPKYEKVTLRLLDLKILQRHADSLGAQLGLVTRRFKVRRDAESLGIPVFASSAAAQKQIWPASTPRIRRVLPPPRRDLREKREEVYVKEAVWRTSLLGRVVTFTTGVLAVLVLAGLFVPRAALTLYPESRTASIVIPVSAGTSIRSISLAGELPAQTISMTVESEGTMNVTSQITLPRNKSRGLAQFTNLGQDEIVIPAGTVVTTETLIRYVTLTDTRLPAGVDQTVEVRVEAVSAGTQGNVDASSITIIEGPLGLSAAVSNPEPTVGGSGEKVIGADEEDRTALRASVMEDLQKTAEQQIRENIGSDDILLVDTLEIREVQREESSPPEGEAGTTLNLSLQAEFTARYILAADLKQLAESSVQASIPQGFSSFGGMTFNLLDAPVTDSSGVTHFQLEAVQTALEDVSTMQVFNLVRGRGLVDANAELMKVFHLRQQTQIVITPSWWRWLPLIPFNLSLEVK